MEYFALFLSQDSSCRPRVQEGLQRRARGLQGADPGARKGEDQRADGGDGGGGAAAAAGPGRPRPRRGLRNTSQGPPGVLRVAGMTTSVDVI